MDREGRRELEDIANMIGLEHEILYDQYLFIPPSKSSENGETHPGVLINRQGEALDIKVNCVHALVKSIPNKTEIVGYVVLEKSLLSLKKDLEKKTSGIVQLIKSDNEVDLANEGFSLFNTLEMMKPKLKVLVIKGDGGFDEAEIYLSNQTITVSYNNITFPCQLTSEFISHRYD